MAKMCAHVDSERDSVSIWYSCRFSIFSVLSAELDWLAALRWPHAVDPIMYAPWSVLRQENWQPHPRHQLGATFLTNHGK